MASVFLYHVVGDLTVGKPELSEFSETETLAAAIRTIGDTSEGGIPVWRKRSQMCAVESAESRQQRFVGILNALDIVAFLAREDCLADQDKAINTPVSEVVVPDSSALKVVDPGTRLIDALEMMKHGVKRFLVPKSSIWRGMSKRFSILYNGRWLKNADPLLEAVAQTPWLTLTATIIFHFFHPGQILLSVKRRRPSLPHWLPRCLGPFTTFFYSLLGAINPNYCCIEASRPAIDATKEHPQDPCAVAVVEPTPDGQHNKIIGEISSAKLWKCDCLAAAWALANLSAGQFVMGVEDNMNSRSLPNDINSLDEIIANGEVTSSLAAVMAQMLSHRASHVWVTEAENDDNLVGVVGYADILSAVTRQPPAAAVSENS
ncbi:hypothetical protein DH2020_021795 [Rehmannia glutinosa]|uniref:CBS domain-containing protein n=1 Tax=Rehmannia glutinosa TaxID=99300 RepID=A0ABR0WFT4_REHGL